MAQVHGTVAKGFELVKEVFQRNFDECGDIGASFCLQIKGEVVVDLWGGWKDKQSNPPIPWEEDTICNVYSCTKAMANLCVLLLIQRKHLDFDMKVSQVWPEFGQCGKENITVQQLLTHQAGLNTLGEHRLTSQDLLEWTEYLQGKRDFHSLVNILESSVPNWELNKGYFGYHPLSIGLFLSELVRRSDPKRRGIQAFWREEIAEPNDIKFYIGLPEDIDVSLARLVSTATLEDGEISSSAPIPPSSTLPFPTKSTKVYSELPIPENLQPNLPKIISSSFTLVKRFSPWKTRFAELPSGIGFGNARALSKAFCSLACSSNESEYGNKIIDKETASKALEKAVEGFDLTLLSHRVLCRAGYFLSENYPGAFYHSGNGGAIVWGDNENHLAMAYTPSHLLAASTHTNGTRAENLIRAVYYCLGKREKINSHFILLADCAVLILPNLKKLVN